MKPFNVGEILSHKYVDEGNVVIVEVLEEQARGYSHLYKIRHLSDDRIRTAGHENMTRLPTKLERVLE